MIGDLFLIPTHHGQFAQERIVFVPMIGDLFLILADLIVTLTDKVFVPMIGDLFLIS